MAIILDEAGATVLQDESLLNPILDEGGPVTLLALAAPTTAITGPPGGGGITGIVLPAAETSLGTNTGFTVPNNGAVLVRVVVGAAGTGTIQFVCQKTIEGVSLQLTAFQQTLANSTVYIFGPFRPSEFNDVNGLLNANLSVVTGNSVGAYILPGTVSGS